jgi:hypothetical protein
LLAEFAAFVFVSERGSPFTTAGFARMIERTTIAVYIAKLPELLGKVERD